MMQLYESDVKCCGCSACASVCPVDNIEMRADKKTGYFFPYYLSEDNCLNCNQCLDVCPMKEKVFGKEITEKEIYAGIINEQKIWEDSASGGGYYAICKALEDKNPIYIGARWLGHNVVMSHCESLMETKAFRKSKYVAADPNNIYRTAKFFLDNGRFVVFSGTPCQINGFVNFLGDNYENLFLIDFACHGQGAPTVFEKWIKHLEKKYKKEILNFSFRTKKIIGDHVNSNCCSYYFADGTEVCVTRDYYHHAYVKGLHMRKSCQDCNFAGMRKSDITLADFKNQRKGLQGSNLKQNYSTMLINTEKGKALFLKLNAFMELHKSDPQFVLKYNPKVYRKKKGNCKRDSFMADFEQDNIEIERLIKQYARILPSEWIEYNFSQKFYIRIRKILWIFDELMKIYMAIKHKFIVITRGRVSDNG